MNGGGTDQPRAVDVAAIERALGQLWAEEENGAAAGRRTLTRACMSNLVVFCSLPEDTGAVIEDLGAIVEQHPARVLLLMAGTLGEPDAIEAYVSAQCHLVGGGKQVCSEQVRLSAGVSATARLPSVVRSLLMADLPTALWWVAPAAPPLAGAVFDDLADMAGQVIYDSSRWRDPEAGVNAVAGWRSRRGKCGFADLDWRLLKPWRRVIAETVDPALVPGALSSLRSVTIDYAGATTVQSWLLVGWLASRLGWRCVGTLSADVAEAACTFTTPSGPARALLRRLEGGAPGVQQVLLEWEESPQTRKASLSRDGHDRVRVRVEGDATGPRVVPLRRKARAALVAQQLADLHGDAVFVESLQAVRRMLPGVDPVER